jgi:predicted MFS family arabinose efflux permease
MSAHLNTSSLHAVSQSGDISRVEDANFRHMVWDIIWFGLAFAASSRFLSIYAIRMGADALHLSLMASLPALMLMFTSGIGERWVRRFSDPMRALMLPSFINRLGFLLPVFTPFFPPEARPYWILFAITLPAITQGHAAIAFLVMLRESVTSGRLTALLSRRSIWLNASIAISALVLGIWLERTPFPLGYQVMFIVSYIFALLSLRECSRIRVLRHVPPPPLNAPHSSPWRSPGFRRVALVTFVIHIAFLAINPLIPQYLVERFDATEGFVALFSMVELAGGALIGTQAPRIAGRFGNRGMIALAMLFLMLAALVTAFAPTLYVTLIGAALTGAAWTAAAVVGLFAFLSENTPPENMTSYSKAYHQVVGLATFAGPLIGGGLVSAGVSLAAMLVIGALLRLVAAPLVDPGLFWHRRAPAKSSATAATSAHV